jgi:TolB-like protein/ketosteroid isomerase-like protein
MFRMKRIIPLLFFLGIIALLISCAGGPGPAAERKPGEPGERSSKRDEPAEEEGTAEAALKKWVRALFAEDAEAYADSYWPNARKEIDLVADKFALEGRKAIVEHQQQLWDNFDLPEIDYSTPEIQRIPEANEVFFHFNLMNIGIHEHILFQERDGEWRVFEHYIFRHWHLAVKTQFQAWADENGSGWLEPEEYDRLHEAAVKLIMAPHEAQNELDQYFDIDENGEINLGEIRLARLYFFGPSLKRLIEIEQGDMVNKLDLNGNGRVDDPERRAATEFALRFNHFNLEQRPVENQFDEKIDMNGNGTLEPEEQIEMFYQIYEPVYLMAHTEDTIQRFVDELPERALAGGDTNVSVEGLEEVEIPDEPKESSNISQKRVRNLENKKIAVVGVDNLNSTISNETIQGLLLFIENSFVNSGKVRVIDRQNIEKITEEYQFQSTSLTDEETAVEIGKLANADLIVTGALSKVGEQYYLNVKVIDVESGEIIGSSIADASVEDVFYDMVNTAVKRIIEP